MIATSIERFVGAAAPARTSGSRRLSTPRLLRFLRDQRTTLATSFQAARDYEQADTAAARREVLDCYRLLRG